MYEALKSGQAEFTILNTSNQVNIIIDTLNNMYGNKKSVDLKDIGGKSVSGVCKANRNISNANQAKLILKSSTGLYERTIDLLEI